jgi:hypothetical protein
VTTLITVGNWRGPDEPEWPDVRDFVDPEWDAGERAIVSDYLRRGFVVRGFRGHSECRFCSVPNGSLELTDGTYLWPEGLSHYVSEHDVRLPQPVLEHITSTLERFRGAQPDDSWWLGHSDWEL